MHPTYVPRARVPRPTPVPRPAPPAVPRPVIRPSGGLRPQAVRVSPPRPVPVMAGPVRAGFPSPAEDYIEGSLDLNAHLIRHPAATFIVRVEGESMTGAGIFPGDLLVVDRSIEPRDGHIVIAAVGGELTVKRLKGRPGFWQLVAEHPDFPPIVLDGEDGDDYGDGYGGGYGGGDAAIWGVVTNSVHSLSPG